MFHRPSLFLSWFVGFFVFILCLVDGAKQCLFYLLQLLFLFPRLYLPHFRAIYNYWNVASMRCVIIHPNCWPYEDSFLIGSLMGHLVQDVTSLQGMVCQTSSYTPLYKWHPQVLRQHQHKPVGLPAAVVVVVLLLFCFIGSLQLLSTPMHSDRSTRRRESESSEDSSLCLLDPIVFLYINRI